MNATPAKPFRVGIDGYNLAIPRGTGVATYGRSLGRCLQQLGHPVDAVYGMSIAARTSSALREIEFFEQLRTERGYKRPKYPSPAWISAMLAAWRGTDASEILLSGRVATAPVSAQLPPADRILNAANLFDRAIHYFRNIGRFAPLRMPDPPAVMHWTYPVPVYLAGARNIYTVHDVVPLLMPYATLDHKPTHLRLLGECLRHGDHVVTVSEKSRDDLLGFFPDAEPDRVTNTYQAVLPPEPNLPPQACARLLRDGYGLEPGGYFLFYGSLEPKKNVARLLQAFLSAEIDLPLVLVSGRAWGETAALLQGRDPDDRRIRQIEYVTPDILATLVQGARAVTFPSLYEGFGLPVIEAMLLGTPVLTTREGSLAEVAGDAALMVDAYDANDIAQGLTRLATDDALCASLRARGTARAELFGMAPFMDRTRAVLDRVMSQQPRR